MSGYAKPSLYVGIAVLQSLLTNKLVVACADNAETLASTHWFQWGIVGASALLNGLLILKAWTSNPKEKPE